VFAAHEIASHGHVRGLLQRLRPDHARVSLPLVPQLLDGVRYMKPSDVPRLEGSELRRYRHRGPTLRSLVTAGGAVPRRRGIGQRQGIAPPGRRRAEGEIAAEFAKLLVQD